MPNISFSKIFNVSLPSEDLQIGDDISFRFVLETPLINDFTASISPGSVVISSLAPSTGYSNVNSPFIDSIATAAENSSIIFTTELSNFYGGNYQFEPNPSSNTIPINPLYPVYGDIDYPFLLSVFDVFIAFLSDGTFIEYRIVKAEIISGKLKIDLNKPVSNLLKDDITNNAFKKMLLLTRIKDETNMILEFKKKPGKTSYGFVIPENIDPNVLKNIDIIAKEVQAKLLSNQQLL